MSVPGDGRAQAPTAQLHASAVPPRAILVATPPPPAWYEHLPTWVSISLFLHGLFLLLIVVLLGSPGTLGLADEAQVDRLRTEQGAARTSIESRVGTLERQTSGLGGAPPVATLLATRIGVVEGRIAALCAAASPPC